MRGDRLPGCSTCDRLPLDGHTDPACAGEAAVDEDELPGRRAWLAALPGVVEEIAREWGVRVGDPYEPGGVCAWVAPADDDLVLKVSWRHTEAEHEADALRFWDGDGAVRCFAARSVDPDTSALLLERCVPGVQLHTLPEPEQDLVIAELARRLHRRRPADPHPFRTLTEMCDVWADSLPDHGLAGAGAKLLRELPRTADSEGCCARTSTRATCSPPSASRGW